MNLEINFNSVMLMNNHKLVRYKKKSVLFYELLEFLNRSFMKSGIELLGCALIVIGGNWRQFYLVVYVEGHYLGELFQREGCC